MKKITILFFAVFFTGVLKAQFDVSVNPVGLLFNSYTVSLEKGMSNNFGVELNLGYNTSKYEVFEDELSSSGFDARIMAKYYLSPSKGLDRFNIAPYFKFGTNSFTDGTDEVSNTRVAGGFYLGYKTVSTGGIFFEIGFGVGKAFVNSYSVNGGEPEDLTRYPLFDIDLTGKFAVGYRFGAK